MNEPVRHTGSMTKFHVKRNRVSIFSLIVIALLIVVAAIVVSNYFKFDIVENLIMAWILTVMYTILAFLIYDSYVVQETEHNYLQETEKKVPVLKEYFHTIDNPIVHVVEKPVYKHIAVPIEKKIYIEKARKKLNIPKYNFVGSTETKTYHARNCRLGKLIKRKYKVQNNSLSYFKNRGFSECKVCIKKSVKG